MVTILDYLLVFWCLENYSWINFYKYIHEAKIQKIFIKRKTHNFSKDRLNKKLYNNHFSKHSKTSFAV